MENTMNSSLTSPLKIAAISTLFATFVVVPSIANAGLITQTQSFAQSSAQDTNGNSALNFIGADLNFNPFDSFLGTLNSVSYSVQGILIGDITITCLPRGILPVDCQNVGALSQIFVGGRLPQISLDAVGITFTPLLRLNQSGSGILADNIFGELDLLNFFNLETFLAGPVGLPVFSSLRATTASPGRVSSTIQQHRISGTATLTYDFTEAPVVVDVPTPASLSMFTAGLVLLGFAAKRRKHLAP